MPFYEWLSTVLDAWLSWHPYPYIAHGKVLAYFLHIALAWVGVLLGVVLVSIGLFGPKRDS